MTIEERIQRYEAIEIHRERPLIVYATSTRQGVPARMAGDVVREFVDQIDKIVDGTKVDILIHSTGGDGLTAWKLMSMLRERFENVSVIVPFIAFSAATIFTLGADEIIMHPHASLGPIDPQITTRSPDGNPIQFSYEDLGAFLKFLEKEAKLTQQDHTASIIKQLFSTIDPVSVGGAQRASELSTQVGARLLSMHMTDSKGKETAKTIAKNLNKSFFAHGDAVSRSRAMELKLKIAEPNPEFEKLIWESYLGLESYMEIRTPFTILQHFLNDPIAKESLDPIPPLKVPPNTPQEVMQQIFQAIANQALKAKPVEVEYKLVNAVIESPRIASECRTIGKVTAWRNINNEISVSRVDYSSKWSEMPIMKTD